MTTLTDVAKKANVSKMTVSRVINHPELVSDELKELVFNCMRDMNYRPNVAARALANNRTNVVKLFILDKLETVEPYYMHLLTGIAQKLEDYHYSLQLVTKNGFDISACDGYVITGMRDLDYEWISQIERPVVLFGENIHGYDFIDSDNFLGTKIATEYAIQRNYENIVFIGTNLDEPFELNREKGYHETMGSLGKFTRMHRFENRSRYASAFIKENWHSFSPDTCFVCSTDRLAIGILREIIAQGGNVPTDFGVIGFDGVFLDQTSSPQLTTIKQSFTAMGSECAEILIKKINQDGKSQGNKVYQPELIVRESTK